MTKLINKNLIFSFLLLALISFGISTPARASASTKHFGYSYESPAVFYPRMTATEVIKSSVNSQATTPKKDPAPATKKTETAVKKDATCATAGTTTNSNSTDKNLNLTANASFGSGGFMPQNILQWFLLAVMVFLIVFLVRKIYRKDQEYKLSPLKHA